MISISTLLTTLVSCTNTATAHLAVPVRRVGGLGREARDGSRQTRQDPGDGDRQTDQTYHEQLEIS